MPLYSTQDAAQTPFVIPTDYSLAGWSFDPVNLQAGTLMLGGGALQVIRVKVMNTTQINTIFFNVTLGGITLVSGRNFAGLYTDAGELLGTTADQTAAWSTPGLKPMQLTAPAEVTPWTWHRVAWFCNGLTAPSLSRGMNTSAAVLNAGMGASTLRYSTANSGLTTALPATLGTMTPSDIAWWVGVA